MDNILQVTLEKNFIKNLNEVCEEIKSLTETELVKGLEVFFTSYNDLPNLFDCGDVEAILYFINK